MLNTIFLLIAISKGEPAIISMYGTERACVKSAKQRMIEAPKRSYQCKPYKLNISYIKELRHER